MLRVLLIWALLLLLFCQQCSTTDTKTSGFTREDIKGSWNWLDSHSNYWELFYSDSLCWGYESAPGLMIRKYQIRNDSIFYYYLSGEIENVVKLESVWPDSMAVTYISLKVGVKEFPKVWDIDKVFRLSKHTWHRLNIPVPIDDRALLAGDTTAEYDYVEGYIKRAEETLMRLDSVRK